MNDELINQAYEKAKEVIKECSTEYGLYASGGPKGYRGVWSRDSVITLMGASSDPDFLFKGQLRKSLQTLGQYQSKLGQIPNAVLNLDKKKRQADFKSIDSSLWYVIGHYFYRSRYRDASLFRRYKKSIKKAVVWEMYRDVGEDVTLEQLPTTDWQDAFPHKYGTAINTQALYYRVLDLIKKRRKKRKLGKIVNKKKGDKLWNGNFYWAYRWKNHNKYKEIGEWFDSLGNILAIVFGLAGKKRAKKILNYIETKRINRPYPLKSIFPPIKRGSEYWEDYYYDAGATPNHYLNGGIWTYIGGFYVLALIKVKRFREARRELEKLAEANLKGNLFPEWIDPKDKKTHGQLQAWSAGTYMWAYNSLKKKKVIM
jgi:glycogen debranching enzyme